MSERRSRQETKPKGEPSAHAAGETHDTAPNPAFRPGTKQALILDLLQRGEGASLDELVAATGWLAHTARAALTGLRKRGIAVEKVKAENGTRYLIRTA